MLRTLVLLVALAVGLAPTSLVPTARGDDPPPAAQPEDPGRGDAPEQPDGVDPPEQPDRPDQPTEPVLTRPSQERVDRSVRRGVDWLKGEQRRGGRFGTGAGETALVLYALRHSGVPADDPVCRRAAKYLVRELPDATVYGAALGVVALLAQDEPGHRIIAQKLVDHIVGAQCRNGQWTYGYRARKVKRSGDNSNTQFAILALTVARARGLEVPAEPFARSRAFFVGSQNDDGGFGYSDRERSRSYAAMTAGGAMCLAFAAAVAADEPAGLLKHAEDPAVRRSLEWLAENFDPAANTGLATAFGNAKGRRSDATWRHYWLWSLERAAAAGAVESLGEHDWYGRGAEVLLERQRDEGSWRDPERDILATSFALLFFRRSTYRAITPSGGALPAITPSTRDAE